MCWILCYSIYKGNSAKLVTAFKMGLISLRCCLQLIIDKPPAVQEELDLIQAVGCLEEFGVKILPLQGELSA